MLTTEFAGGHGVLVPAIAWLEAATLIVLLCAIVVIAIGVAYWWFRLRRWGRRE